MSSQIALKLKLPEWYLMERQTQETIIKLTRFEELEFYINHPDEYIRHQAIFRLGQIKAKESIPLLIQITEDSLESPTNREIAAWVLKSSVFVKNDDYFIGNRYLDRFNGDEKLTDFYLPEFQETCADLNYRFGASRIQPLLKSETILFKAESIENKVDIPFSIRQWLKSYSGEIIKDLITSVKKGIPALWRGIKNTTKTGRTIINKAKNKKRKQKPYATGEGTESGTTEILSESKGIGFNNKPEDMATEPETQGLASGIHHKETNGRESDQHERIGTDWAAKDREKNFIRPFALETVSGGKGNLSGKNRMEGKRKYIQSGKQRLFLRERVKILLRYMVRILIFPFVVLWNQKVVFIIILVCLYVFYSFVPYGRLMFFEKTPELARFNDEVVRSVEDWIGDKIVQVKEKVSENELFRDIRKHAIAGGTPVKPEPEKKIEKYKVTAQNLNMRQQPGLSGERLLVLEYNTTVEYMDKVFQAEDGGKWLYIKSPDGTVGWSHSRWLEKIIITGMEAYGE